MAPAGRDVRQGSQREASFMEARVRQDETPEPGDAAPEVQDVAVDCAGPVAEGWDTAA